MPETYFIRDLLFPELDTEIGETRRLFEALPDDRSDFKPYEKSMTLGRLAGHTTDLFRMIALTLTMSELDMAVVWQPYTMVLKGEMLKRFEDNASDALAAFKQSSDEALHQPWTDLSYRIGNLCNFEHPVHSWRSPYHARYRQANLGHQRKLRD